MTAKPCKKATLRHLGRPSNHFAVKSIILLLHVLLNPCFLFSFKVTKSFSCHFSAAAPSLCGIAWQCCAQACSPTQAWPLAACSVFKTIPCCRLSRHRCYPSCSHRTSLACFSPTWLLILTWMIGTPSKRWDVHNCALDKHLISILKMSLNASPYPQLSSWKWHQ